MKKFNSKKMKFGANDSIIVIFALCIVILLNAVAFFAEEKFPALKLDLTQSALTKITDETKNVLRTLDESDIMIDVIYLKGTADEDSDVMDVIRQYGTQSDNIDVSVENYVKNPTIISTYGVESQSAEGAVVVSNKEKNRSRIIYASEMWSQSGTTQTFLLESRLTNAIGFIMSEREINVVMSTGHEEADTSLLTSMMTAENITVSQLDLSTSSIPAYTDLFMIIAPQNDFTQAEIDALDEFLIDGGSVALAFGFTISTPRLEEYAASWGLTVNNDIILEQEAEHNYQQSGMYFFPYVTQNEITGSITNRIFTATARSLSYSTTGDITATPILTTSAEANSVPIDSEGQLDKNNLTQGQFNIGYLLEKPVGGSYENTANFIVTSTPSVWGAVGIMLSDYDVYAAYALSEPSFGNKDFVMNSVQYVADYSSVSVSVPDKSRTTTIMSMTSSQSAILRIVLCVALPILIILMGIIVWAKRRHL